jgi:hypothetical protein
MNIINAIRCRFGLHTWSTCHNDRLCRHCGRVEAQHNGSWQHAYTAFDSLTPAQERRLVNATNR